MPAPGTATRVDFERGMRTAPPLILLLIAANVALFAWELAAGALASRESIVEAGAPVGERVLAGAGLRPVRAALPRARGGHLVGNLLVVDVVGMGAQHPFRLARPAVVEFYSPHTV